MPFFRFAARRPLIACTLAYICFLVLLDHRGYFSRHAGLPAQAATVAEGIVIEPPETTDGRSRFALDTLSIGGTPAREHILVTSYGMPDVRAGNVLRLTGTLKTPQGLRNPGGFDYRTYLSRQGIRYLFYADSVTVCGHRPPPWYRSLAFAAREDVLHTIRAYLPAEEASVLIPMIIGDKSALTADMKRDFNDAGVTHILVASGMNVAYCTAIFLGLFRLAGLSRRRASLLTIPFILLYVLATGASAPVVRAGVMALFVILSLTLAREPDIFQSLGCAALVILLFDPQALFTASFQLSFGATLGIVALYPVLARPFAHLPFWLRYSLGAPVAVSLAAQAGVLPLIAYYFNKLSLIGILSNIVIVPLTAVITALGMAIYLAHFIAAPLAHITSLPAAFLVSLLLRLVRFFAAVPGATLHVISPSVFSIAVYYIVLFGAMKLRDSPVCRYAVLAAAVLWIGIFVTGRWAHRNDVRVTFLDVGNGDAVCVEFDNGAAWLIDGGGSYRGGFDPGEKIVCPYLWSRGIRRLDTIVVTHPHLPHYGGLAAVLRQFPVNRVLAGPSIPAAGAYSELQKIAKERNVCWKETGAGQRFFAGSSTVTVLSPGVREETGADNCLVIVLDCHGRRLLLTSDMGEAEERRLAGSAGMHLAAMQLPSHGRRAVSDDFLQKYQADFYVVSGKGCPRLDRGDGSSVIATGDQGAVSFIIEPARISRTGYR